VLLCCWYQQAGAVSEAARASDTRRSCCPRTYHNLKRNKRLLKEADKQTHNLNQSESAASVLIFPGFNVMIFLIIVL